MSSNGNMNQGVPPDIVWDENDPPVVFECSQHIEHMPGCDGLCGRESMTELQVKLLNEGRAWARAGMSFLGIPASLQEVSPVPGIHVEIFDLQCYVQTLMEIILEKLEIDAEDIEERFRARKFINLRQIRNENEKRVRNQRTEQILGVKHPIIGPDGRPL